MAKPDELPEDLARFRASYAELFGSVPPLPESSRRQYARSGR